MTTSKPTCRVRLFAGTKAALRPFVLAAAPARVVALGAQAQFLVLPLTDDVHEALHRAYGTGEWWPLAGERTSPLLTTTDVAFAGRASAGTALAFIDLAAEDDWVEETAAVWLDGAAAMKPALKRASDHWPRALCPVNKALRLLGVSTVAGGDETAAFGLRRYRSAEDMVRRAVEVAV